MSKACSARKRRMHRRGILAPKIRRRGLRDSPRRDAGWRHCTRQGSRAPRETGRESRPGVAFPAAARRVLSHRRKRIGPLVANEAARDVDIPAQRKSAHFRRFRAHDEEKAKFRWPRLKRSKTKK
jgi:hypothetical protein